MGGGSLGHTVTELRVTLTVADFDQAVALYRDALGLREIADWSSPSGRVVALEAGQGTLELLDQSAAQFVDEIEAGRRVAGQIRLGFEVGESETAARQLLAAGAEPVAGPVTTPWGDRNARMRAPDGMQLTLFTTPSRTATTDGAEPVDRWVWPASLEGPLAAPNSHRVLFDTSSVGVLEVIVEPGTREPQHTHRYPSVMIIDQPARIRYYDAGELTFESAGDAPSPPGPRTSWLEPEGPHAAENIDDHAFHAFRIELRDPGLLGG